MHPVAIFDVLFLSSVLAALALLFRGWGRAPFHDSRFVLSGLLITSMLYAVCLTLEWTGITDAFDTVEDFLGALLPMWWAFFLYSLLQESASRELRNRETELRDSRRRLSTLLNNLPGMAYRCRNDRKWTMEFVSIGALELTGYEPEQLVDNQTVSYESLILSEDRERVWQTVQTALQERRPFQMNYGISAASGEEKWVWEQGMGIYSEQGEVIALEGFITDITEQRRAEEAILRSERRLADIIDFLPDPTFVVSRQGEVIIWNRAMEELTGIKASHIKGKSGYEYAFPFWKERKPVLADLAMDWDEAAACTYPFVHRENLTLLTEVRVPGIRPEGIYLWAKAAALCDPDGSVMGAVESIRDITKRKELEQALQDAVERYEILFDNLPVGVVAMDSNLRITRMNTEGSRITGYEGEEAVGKACYEVLHGQLCHTSCPIRNALKHPHSRSSVESEITRRDGARIPVRINAGCLYTSGGELSGGVEVFQDISELKNLEAERANIISMFAHDMKSPLVGIHGFAAHLLSRSSDLPQEKLTRFLEVIGRESSRLESLVNDFLDFSRLETGGLKLRFDDTEVGKEIQDILELFEHRFQQASIRVMEKGLDALPIIQADATRLRRVFTNLLENALKYSEAGATVTVEGRETPQEVIVLFSDQGLGIRPEELPHIFNMFYRGRTPGKREGHGLGLAGVDAIVKGHGGRVLVCSTLGVGSTFMVGLPKEQHGE